MGIATTAYVTLACQDVKNSPALASGQWTPTVTFATPGDVAVTYATRSGAYYKIGNLVFVNFVIQTSAFTWATSAGDLRITGLPYAAPDITSGGRNYLAAFWQGITKAGFTDLSWEVSATNSYLVGRMYASGSAFAQVDAADVPSGGTLLFQGSGTYLSSA